MFKNIKIKTKLTLGFLLVAFWVGLMGWFGVRASQQAAESYQEFKKFEKNVDAASEASSYAKRAEGHLLLALMLNSKEDEAKFPQRQALLEEQVLILKSEVMLPKALEQVGDLELFTDEILSYGNQLLQLQNKEPKTFAAIEHQDLIRKFHEAASGARKAGVEIVNIETNALSENIARATEEAKTAQRLIEILALILVFSAVGFGLFVSRLISKSVIKAKNVAVEIAQGNMDVEIDTTGRDEIGELNRAVAKMRDSLKIVFKEYQNKLKI